MMIVTRVVATEASHLSSGARDQDTGVQFTVTCRLLAGGYQIRFAKRCNSVIM